MIKKKSHVALALLLTVLLFSFGNAAGNDFVALMKGCNECGNCKKRVVKSLAKMNGVTSVRFLKEKNGALHQVEVHTKGNEEISFNEVRQAIAEVEHFELKKWDKVSR